MWDLTRTMREDMPVHPGAPEPVLKALAVPERDGYGMSEYRLWNHTGTHIDGQRHFVAGGRALDDYPLERFVTPATVVKVTSGPVTAAMLARALGDEFSGEAVVLVTGAYARWGTPDYFDFPVLSDDGARWLIAHRVGLLGIDACSVDPVDTESFPIHHVLLEGDCLIIENLAYTPELPDRFRLVALPIKVGGSNGDPARVIGLPLQPWPTNP